MDDFSKLLRLTMANSALDSATSSLDVIALPGDCAALTERLKRIQRDLQLLQQSVMVEGKRLSDGLGIK